MEEPNWKDLLAFSKRERNGILTLLILIVLTLAGRTILPEFVQKEMSISDEAYKRMDSLQQKIITLEKDNEVYQSSYYKPKKNNPKQNGNTELTPFKFNPNTLTKSGWKNLGFSDRDVNMIMNFKDAGGSFHKKQDLKKLYCISDIQYKKLEPYIQLEVDTLKLERSGNKSHAFKGVVKLNDADTVDLLKIPGIGPFYARQILKYREMLGGFVLPEQISEVYGLEKKYKKLLPYVKVDTLNIRKININKAKYYDILKHPYIDKTLAYQITEYRRLNGSFEDFEEVRKMKNIPDSILKKIEPYLKVK
ncbi:MAG: helix-hairpin-helix domain-containing protein [Bacteroidales bacterium]|nr:helix-hairpin-helix domain-containing protein [Bacteroidales bacterium]